MYIHVLLIMTEPEITLNNIVFFDGICNFCNNAVNFLIDRDPNRTFKFASLQSDLARGVLPKYGVDPSKMHSIILLKNGKMFQRSSAALEITKNMSGAWPLLGLLKIVPVFMRDFFYNFIANNRYKWFGKLDSCRMPTPEIRERFLDSSYSN